MPELLPYFQKIFCDPINLEANRTVCKFTQEDTPKSILILPDQAASRTMESVTQHNVVIAADNAAAAEAISQETAKLQSISPSRKPCLERAKPAEIDFA